MKTIEIYKIIETPYRYGDVQLENERYFSTPELRDDYFYNVLKKSYLDNSHYTEIEVNNFEDKSQKWCYEITKKDEMIHIAEDLSELD